MGPTLDGANAGWRPPPSPRSIPRRRYHFHSMPVHSKRMAWRNPRVSPPATLPHDTGRPARVLWARTSLSHAGGTWEVCDRGHTGAERPIDPYWPGHAVRRADATVLAAGRAERGAAAGQGARAGAPAWRGPGAVPHEQGRAGLLGLHCAHRGADLSYGRLEDGGLRCLYHGWLYDVAGRCLEQPGEP